MNVVAGLPRRLSVLDDETDVVDGLQRRLSRRGFAVERVVPPSANLEDTVVEIMRVSEVALCDHHLRGGHMVDFSGADVVAELTARHFPAVLFTGVKPAEKYAIRRHMARIPAFLSRADGLGDKRVIDAIGVSVAEVRDGHRLPGRRGRRTPVTIVSSRVTGKERLVEVVVSGWPSQRSIEIPADLLSEPWATSPTEAEGRTFLARVNIGEMDPDKLFFERFEPEPLETEDFLGLGAD